ncbi:MAG: PhnB protein [Thermoleophilaceae bacterium]|jgi:PhnB protein|nr:PhnB protein [Thermoleophilaceae bacterium]
MPVNPIPENYPRVTAYLIVEGADAAIDFYKRVLGGEERVRMGGPDGRVGHAELQFGDSVVMLADAYPEMDIRDPKAIGGTPVSMTIYVEDVDKTYAEALDAGAREVQPLEDKFYGDRAGQFEDPFGHRWTVTSHVEDVSPEEMQKRAEKLAAEGH